jgi:hypothetical protein
MQWAAIPRGTAMEPAVLLSVEDTPYGSEFASCDEDVVVWCCCFKQFKGFALPAMK